MGGGRPGRHPPAHLRRAGRGRPRLPSLRPAGHPREHPHRTRPYRTGPQLTGDPGVEPQLSAWPNRDETSLVPFRPGLSRVNERLSTGEGPNSNVASWCTIPAPLVEPSFSNGAEITRLYSPVVT